MDMWNEIVLEFASLLGFASLLALIINVLKVIKINGKPIVSDGNAQKWSLGGNLIGLLALYIFRIFKPDIPVVGVDSVLLEIATVGSYILSTVLQLGITKLTNFVVKGLPIIGKSFSLDASKKLDSILN
jgi:hypothetical protein